MNRVFFALVVLSLIMAFSHMADAFDIQTLETRHHVRAWLLEDHQLPIVTIRFGWRGGVNRETPDTDGISRVLAEMLIDGGNVYDRFMLHDTIAKYGIKLGIWSEFDNISGRMTVLRAHRHKAARLLRGILTNPRFSESALDRIRNSLIDEIDAQREDAQIAAVIGWYERAFDNDHPYGRLFTATTLKAITPSKLRDWHRRNIARDNLIISVAGAVSPREATAMLNTIFDTLPREARLPPIRRINVNPKAATKFTPIENVPQTTIVFGHGGIAYDDPQFFGAYLMNHILGGATLTSRLAETIRRKNGLVYSINTSLQNLADTTIWLGKMATDNTNVERTLTFLRQEMHRIRNEPIDEQTLADAKSFLIDSYLLRLDSNLKIATQLFALQWRGENKNYLETRKQRITAVTIADVQAVAQKMLHPEAMIISTSGGTNDMSLPP